MMKMLRTLLVVASLTVLLTGAVPAPAQAGSISCASEAVLSRPVQVNGSRVTCYTFAVPKGSTSLRIDLAATGGTFDLYVKGGKASSVEDADKVNVSAVSGSLAYALVNPRSTSYTIAAVPTGRSGQATLSAAGARGTGQPSYSCSGKTCRALYPLVAKSGSGVAIGPAAGDQVILPVEITRAGRVDVNVTWKGTARSLSAFLYGPNRSGKGGPLASYARKDGASPLALTYNVQSSDLLPGGQWSVGLVNSGRSGGTVTSGQVSVTYQR